MQLQCSTFWRVIGALGPKIVCHSKVSPFKVTICMSISFWMTKAAFWENTTPAPWPCVWCVPIWNHLQSFTYSPHSLKCEKRRQPSNFLDSISTNAGSRCSRQRSPDRDVLSFKVHWLLIEERSSSQVVEDISHVGVELELTYISWCWCREKMFNELKRMELVEHGGQLLKPRPGKYPPQVPTS